MANCTSHQHWLRWSGDVVRGNLLTGLDPRMIGCLEYQTGHRAKLATDLVEAI